ncbi:hypothetical protein ACVWZM_002005 [Bradyrhizobium sp. USDA 4501]
MAQMLSPMGQAGEPDRDRRPSRIDQTKRMSQGWDLSYRRQMSAGRGVELNKHSTGNYCNRYPLYNNPPLPQEADLQLESHVAAGCRLADASRQSSEWGRPRRLIGKSRPREWLADCQPCSGDGREGEFAPSPRERWAGHCQVLASGVAIWLERWNGAGRKMWLATTAIAFLVAQRKSRRVNSPASGRCSKSVDD